MEQVWVHILKVASLIAGTSITIYPQNAINDTGPYDFLIPSDDNDYTFLPLTRLYGELEVVKTDGTPVTAAEKNGIVNLFPHSIFKQIECSINGTQICDLSTPTYPYKAFIETHLSFNKHAKEGHLYCECYSKETVGKENNFEISTAAEPNPAFDLRKKLLDALLLIPKRIQRLSQILKKDQQRIQLISLKLKHLLSLLN